MAGWSGRRGSIRGISLGHVRSLEAQERAPVLEVGIGPELRMEPESFDSQSWDRLPLVVDGQPVIFDRTTKGQTWYAFGQFGHVRLHLRVRNFPAEQVELQRLADASAYMVDFVP